MNEKKDEFIYFYKRIKQMLHTHHHHHHHHQMGMIYNLKSVLLIDTKL